MTEPATHNGVSEVILFCGQHITSDARNIAIGNTAFSRIYLTTGNSDLRESI